jgi:hypothetical protein
VSRGDSLDHRTKHGGFSMTRRVALLIAAFVALSAVNLPARAATPTPSAPAGPATELVPRSHGSPTRFAPGGGSGGGGGGSAMVFHGGPLTTSIKVAEIWYGNWAGNTATGIVRNFETGLSGSAYWKINATYTNAAGVAVAPTVGFLASTTDNYSQGVNLTDAQVQQVVFKAITDGRLPYDANTVYLFMGSADVNLTSGYGTSYCGWHTYGSLSGRRVTYLATINPDRAPSACEAESSGPNGNAGADARVSILAHEIEETATDPQLNAWYDRRGYENADKCAWTFGTTYATANGSRANMKLPDAGGVLHDYLIQRNWLNVGSGSCALSR